MTTTPSASSARLVLATAFVAVAALVVGTSALLRVPPRAAAAPSLELDAIRQEVAELRHSVELTRSQLSAPGNSVAIADAEQRLARIEARLATTPATPGVAPTPATPADATPPASTLRDSPPGNLKYDPEGRLLVPKP